MHPVELLGQQYLRLLRRLCFLPLELLEPLLCLLLLLLWVLLVRLLL